MISTILFDLDGVLVDADKLHYQALNDALIAYDASPISWQEHVAIYKGLTTATKLKILSERAKLPSSAWQEISDAKQISTLKLISDLIKIDREKVVMLEELKKRFAIAVCSNAKRESVEKMLISSGLIKYCDFYLSNEDVSEPKPAPEIYLKAMQRYGVSADECLIVEDSDVGKQAARAAGGVLLSVSDPSEVNYYRIATILEELETPRIVIPAAGQGKRFLEAGFVYPKPLIRVNERPMIELVLSNFRGLGEPIVILQSKHCATYSADKVIQQIQPGCRIVTVDGLTQGAACTVLETESIINDSRELIIANSDQYLDVDLSEFLRTARSQNVDGSILTFHADETKWSYAALGEDGFVTHVAEKQVISPHATVGIYYFKRGKDFVRAARQMIDKKITVNGEYYVCPIFNELIGMGGKVSILEIPRQRMHGLGTPEDLERYLGRKQETKIIELGDTSILDEHSSVDQGRVPYSNFE